MILLTARWRQPWTWDSSQQGSRLLPSHLDRDLLPALVQDNQNPLSGPGVKIMILLNGLGSRFKSGPQRERLRRPTHQRGLCSASSPPVNLHRSSVSYAPPAAVGGSAPLFRPFAPPLQPWAAASSVCWAAICSRLGGTAEFLGSRPPAPKTVWIAGRPDAQGHSCARARLARKYRKGVEHQCFASVSEKPRITNILAKLKGLVTATIMVPHSLWRHNWGGK